MVESHTNDRFAENTIASVQQENLWGTLDDLWTQTLGSREVCIALLDGPVDLTHRSFEHAPLLEITPTFSADLVGGPASIHGTQLASIIFGQHDGSVRGIAPNCRGVSIPIFRDEVSSELPACSQADLGRAIMVALEAGAHIINISAGEYAEDDAVDPLLLEAIDTCVDSGVLIIAAAGDFGCINPQIPSAFPSVLAVGKVGSPIGSLEPGECISGEKSHCLLAPGEDIHCALPGGEVGEASGSSYASAVVSGVAALLLSLQLKSGHQLDIKVVREALLGTARKVNSYSGCFTGGLLDARAAASHLHEQMTHPSIERTSYLPDEGADQALSLEHYTFTLSVHALEERYANVSREKFGSVDVMLPNGVSYNKPDLQYLIGPGRKGMYILPANDHGDVTLTSGLSVPGSEVVDAYLRQRMDLAPGDPIYALISYIRPEEHSIDLAQLHQTSKIQMGHRHLAAYVGQGRTTHVLPRKTDWQGEGPLQMKWNVDRFPVNVQVVGLQGVPQSTLNRNAHIVDAVIASTAKSPENTRTLKCRTIDINTTLQYYRDSIRRAEYLEDISWYTNCTIHKVAVINIMLNVPHNEGAFGEIFGEDGAQLWLDFMRRYEEVHGEEFCSENETHFVPLWKLQGLNPKDIQPLTLGEYGQFNAARAEGLLDEYTGSKPLDPGIGLAWPLETVVDLVGGFLNTYVSFEDAGGIATAGSLLLLRNIVQQTLNVSEGEYLAAVSPIISLFLSAESLAKRTSNPQWLSTAAVELINWVKSAEEVDSLEPGPAFRLAVERCAERAQEELEWLSQGRDDEGVNVAEQLRQVLALELDKLRTKILSQGGDVTYFSTPSILHQLALGAHPKNPLVSVKTVCTVMDHRELVPYVPHPPPILPSSDGEELTREKGQVQKALEQQRQITEDTIMEHVRMPAESEAARSAQLIYALGRIGYSFVSQSRRDSIKQKMDGLAQPEEPEDILAYLDANPHDASAIQWVLELEATPVYVLEPRGPFAREAYDLLRQFLREQVTEGVERVSIPGTITGTAKHRSGLALPVVNPEIRGMYSWTTEALVDSLIEPTADEAGESGLNSELRAGVKNFLERVYYEIRNLGREPRERALNFAATNAFEAESVFEQAMSEEMELDTIDVEPSPVCTPGSDCWDVKLVFFFPKRQIQTVKKLYRFTVDVTDVVPVTVGKMRSWSTR